MYPPAAPASPDTEQRCARAWGGEGRCFSTQPPAFSACTVCAPLLVTRHHSHSPLATSQTAGFYPPTTLSRTSAGLAPAAVNSGGGCVANPCHLFSYSLSFFPSLSFQAFRQRIEAQLHALRVEKSAPLTVLWEIFEENGASALFPCSRHKCVVCVRARVCNGGGGGQCNGGGGGQWRWSVGGGIKCTGRCLGSWPTAASS